MSLVWRKIQRSSKKAAKYKFVCQLQELAILCGRKWQPQKVAVAWVHRRRRYSTKDHQWEPSITDPYRGIIVWPVEKSECLEIVTTLYRDSRQETFDDKEWTFIVEGVSPRGKRKALAGLSLNLRLFVNEIPGTQTELQLKLKPLCEHVQVATMKLILSCQMLKEGSALDDDMQSVASAMSVSHRKADIADLSELDNLSPGESSHSMGALIDSSPPTTPDDGSSRSKQVPSEIIATASDIANAWQRSEEIIPKSSSPSPSSSPSLFPRVGTRENKRERAPSLPKSTKAAVEPDTQTGLSSVAQPINKPQAMVDLPPTGSDLLSWCQAATRGYHGVNVVDFSKCWRNGLAFCAIIHRFRPDIIGNFDSLRPDDVRGNCKKAFDAAASLGVPKLIDPEEMVIMVVPDKIAVTSYVYNLRAALTGDSTIGGGGGGPGSIRHRHSPWSPFSFRSSEEDSSGGGGARGEGPFGTPDGEEENKKISSSGEEVTDSSSAGVRKSEATTTDPQYQKPLMTRNQLMNPFDSDGEETEKTKPASPRENETSVAKVAPKPHVTSTPAAAAVTTPVPASAQVSSNPPAPSSTTSIRAAQQHHDQPRPAALSAQPIGGGTNRPVDRQEDLKRRARMLLQQFQTDEKRSSIDGPLSPEDEQRRQELKDRARQLIEEAQRQPTNVLKISELISTANEELWPPRPSRPPGHQPPASSAPTTRQTTPEHRQYIAPQPVLTKESLRDAVQQAEGGAFDRFKRFGSMRTQELSQSINFLSSRFLYQKGLRSASVPKELSHVHNAGMIVKTEMRTEPTKTDDALERDTRSRNQILAEIEQLAARQRILDQNAADVEKRWRTAMQNASGTELEQSLMNEYLSLLNERNMLTRRDMYLNILEKIRDHEERFQDVQRQLGELMKLEESEKTELHKRQIDELMEKLIDVVNRRDELVQQLMAHEQGTQEAAELAEMNHSLPMANEEKNCVIQ